MFVREPFCAPLWPKREVAGPTQAQTPLQDGKGGYNRWKCCMNKEEDMGILGGYLRNNNLYKEEV